MRDALEEKKKSDDTNNNKNDNDNVSNGIQCANDIGDTVQGKNPTIITNDPSQVAGADICILALPSFTHEQYLTALKDYLKPGIILGAMPGEGGFDLCARHCLGADFVAVSHLFATETLPWACRIRDYGKSVEVLGTKKEIDVVIKPKNEPLIIIKTTEMDHHQMREANTF